MIGGEQGPGSRHSIERSFEGSGRSPARAAPRRCSALLASFGASTAAPFRRHGDRGPDRGDREREMAGRLLGIVHEHRQAPVQILPLRKRRIRVQNRSEQRMRESNATVDDLDDPRLERDDQRRPPVLATSLQRGEEISSRVRERSDGEQHVPFVRRDPPEPFLHERAERLWSRKAPAAPKLEPAALGEGARELEREERVPPGCVVQLPQRRPGKRASPRSRFDQVVQRDEAPWPELDPASAVPPEASVRARAPMPDRPPSCDSRGTSRAPRQATGGERDHLMRGGIEPLQVVDGDQHRPVGRRPGGAQSGTPRRRRAVRAALAAGSQQQRDLQRVPLGLRQAPPVPHPAAARAGLPSPANESLVSISTGLEVSTQYDRARAALTAPRARGPSYPPPPRPRSAASGGAAPRAVQQATELCELRFAADQPKLCHVIPP